MGLWSWLKGEEQKAVLENVQDWPWSLPLSGGGTWLTGSGGTDAAIGLPALLGVVLRLSQGVGMVPLHVYSRADRQPQRESWQWKLLNERPSYDSTPFTWKADVAGSVATAGYACCRKYKVDGGRVADLTVLDSSKVIPKRSGGRLVFEDSTEGTTVVRDQSDILYIRGMAMRGSVVGMSPITAARMTMNNALKRQSFEGSFLDNSGQPGVVVAFPDKVTPVQAEAWRDLWKAAHAGPMNAGNPAVVGGGATITPMPVSMEDAQFVEAMQLTSEQIAGIYAVPKSFLSLAGAPTETEWRFFVTFALGWILTAIDQAVTADVDLFGDGRLYAESMPDALLKQDTKTRYDAYRIARQGGWITPNEIRSKENLAPVEGGDEIQVTPVGGAPNVPQTPTEPKSVDELLNELLQER